MTHFYCGYQILISLIILFLFYTFLWRGKCCSWYISNIPFLSGLSTSKCWQYLLIISLFSDGEHYESCSRQGGRVVSQVFCLPQDYRKDVLPPSKYSNSIQYMTEGSIFYNRKEIFVLCCIFCYIVREWRRVKMIIRITVDVFKGGCEVWTLLIVVGVFIKYLFCNSFLACIFLLQLKQTSRKTCI